MDVSLDRLLDRQFLERIMLTGVVQGVYVYLLHSWCIATCTVPLAYHMLSLDFVCNCLTPSWF